MIDISRRNFLQLLAAAPLARGIASPPAPARETLYNGITLASPWPPPNRYLSDSPIAPPYELDPPRVIPIDVGRQLFVDDFLIEETTLTRTFHRAEYHPASPVLRPATEWERRDDAAERTHSRSNPAAMVFSDGVFYDGDSRLFKMWYMGGYNQNTCLATSVDGIVWERPSLDVVPGTNIVHSELRDSSTVWLDVDARPEARYKMAMFNGSERGLLLFVSRDGVHWRRVGKTGPTGDRSTMFYNLFRRMWVFSLRGTDAPGVTGRYRRYAETPEFPLSSSWGEHDPVVWVGADRLDPPRLQYAQASELYNLDCVAYESVLLGLFTIFRGEGRDREKPNDVCVGFSRDGFHWSRPSRAPFVGVSERVGAWNWANVQSAGGCCLVVGDRLFFYVSGRQGVPGTDAPGICSTGLATLRRDGFASLTDADDPTLPIRTWRTPSRQVTTRIVRFSGRHLFVNADVTRGTLHAEILDATGRVIEPFSAAQVDPVAGVDGTRVPVSWKSRRTLQDLAGREVRFRFHVTGGRLYAFWVSASDTGTSRGYVGAGGPGYRRMLDA